MTEIGQVYVKIVGREARQICAAVDTSEGSFITVSGPKVKRRKCNLKHLEPLPQKLQIKKGASDDEVAAALKSAGLVADVKKRTEKREKKAQQRAPRKQHNKVKPTKEEKQILTKARKFLVN